eukprot:CAMPEP_0119028030 /NCGR_PEP_ID=MMETSP1176-20130426/38186_1 /TAXON_ID=265551 /ORGANISM="Synedropsis recta cf, Strain CCMP1620" /LENGTH=288 /DNA_ID=CAMNT_0006984081 /DNA_START=418 /DNA_END=1284 /DNA_ORIENTATION=+
MRRLTEGRGANRTLNDSQRRVHLITYIGLEGTGHHLLQTLTRTFADTVITADTRLYKILNTRFEKSTKGVPPAVNDFSLDSAANDLDRIIDISPKSNVFALAAWSNPFGNKIFSGVDPIDMVELTNRSRHNVTLSLMILHRNFTKIIWSTAKSRKFASVSQKVIELQNSAIVLNAQLGETPLCSWRTFDIDDFPKRPHDYHVAFAKFFRVNDSARVESAFQKMESHFVAPKSSTSKYDTLWAPGELMYVADAFDRPSLQKLWAKLTESRYNLLTDFDQVGCSSDTWKN